MQRDYYAFQRPRLRPILAALERAAEAFEMAKAANDKNVRPEAEEQMKKAAKQAVAIAPHLAYLWFEAFKQEAERRRDEKQGAIFSDGENAVQKAWGSGLTVADSTCDGQQPRDFCKIPDELKFSPAIEDLGRLPRLSFLFVVPFRLRKPYLSKDERDFYLLDNPLRREKVFRTPMVAATGWKGALRSAMVRELVSWWREQEEGERKPEEFAYRRFRLALLFGDEKGEEAGRLEGLAEYLDNVGGEEAAEVFRHKVREYFELKEEDRLSHFRGRLHFFPTFFEEVGLEVINPHDRKTGVGVRGPILMECVPAEAEGMFRLLYVPFAPHAGKEESSPKEAAEDLVAVAEGVRAMLTKYGFGAKTSSGFGVAKGKLPKEGKLVINAELAVPASSASTEKRVLPPYLESEARLKPEYLRDDGSLKSWEEYEAWMREQRMKVGKRSRKRYEEAKRWYAEQYPRVLQKDESDRGASCTRISFASLEGLVERAEEAAEQLRRGDGNE